MREHLQKLTQQLHEKLPARQAILVPGEYFFGRFFSIPDEVVEEDLHAFAELSLEGLSPFPLEQLSWGYFRDLPARRLYLYAAYRERLRAVGYGDWSSEWHVFPSFITLFGHAPEKPTIAFLAESRTLSAIYYDGDSPIPGRIVNYPIRELPEEGAESGSDAEEKAGDDTNAKGQPSDNVNISASGSSRSGQEDRGDVLRPDQLTATDEEILATYRRVVGTISSKGFSIAPVIRVGLGRPDQAGDQLEFQHRLLRTDDAQDAAAASSEDSRTVQEPEDSHTDSEITQDVPDSVSGQGEEKALAIEVPDVPPADSLASASEPQQERDEKGQPRATEPAPEAEVKPAEPEQAHPSIAAKRDISSRLLPMDTTEIWLADIRDPVYKMREKRDRNLSQKIWRASQIVIGVALLLLVTQLLLFATKGWVSNRQDKVKRQAETVQKIEKQHEQKEKMMQLVEFEMRPFEMLEIMNRARPEDVYFTQATSDGWNQMEIEGEADNASAVNLYVQELENHATIDSVEIGKIGTHRNKSQFTLNLRFNESIMDPVYHLVVPEPEEGEDAENGENEDEESDGEETEQDNP